MLYEYKARCVRVVDGDTVDFDIDLGLSVHSYIRVRLADINTPEIFGVKKESEEYAKGIEAKQRVEDLILDKPLVVRTVKDKTGKYGRYIAYVYVDGSNEPVNDMLVKEGLAERVEY